MKRWKKIVLIICGFFFAILLAGTIVLNSEKIQTSIVSQFTAQYKELFRPSTIEVGSIYFQFPLRLTIKDVTLFDQQGDSLLYAGEVYGRVSALALLRHQVCVRCVSIDDLRVHAYSTSDSTYNYTFLLQAFQNEDTTDTGGEAMEICLQKVEVSNAHICYDDMVADVDYLCFALPHSGANDIEATISDLQAQVRRTGQSECIDIQSLVCHFVWKDSLLAIPSLQLKLPHSSVHLSGGITGAETGDAHLIHPQLDIEEMRVALSDLQFFAPGFRNIRDYIDLHGHVGGRGDSLATKDVSLHLNGERIFLGHASVIGFPHWQTLQIDASCNDLYVPTRSVERIIAHAQREPFVFPEEVYRLGTIHYRGYARERLGYLTLQGALTTQIGTITLNGQCTMDSTLHHIQAEGSLMSNRFDVGALLANNDMGEIALELTTKMQWIKDDKLQGDVRMAIDEFTYKGYPYRDIAFQGSFDHLSGTFSGSIHDRYLDWCTEGDFNLNGDTVHHVCLVSHLNRCCPGELHWSERYAQSELATVIRVSEHFSDWDHMEGKVVIDSTYLRNEEAETWIRHQQFSISTSESFNQLYLDGDVVSGELSGQFLLSRLPLLLQKQAMMYLPSAFSEAQLAQMEQEEMHVDGHVEFQLLTHQTQELQSVLRLPIRVSDDILVHGYINGEEEQWSLETTLPSLTVNNKAQFHHIELTMDNTDEQANVHLSWELDQANIAIQTQAVGDSIDLFIHLSALPPDNSHGSIHSITHLSHYGGLPLIKTHLFPSVIQLGDSVYHIDDSYVTYSVFDSILDVSHFGLRGQTQSITVDGVASSNRDDSLMIQLADIDFGLLMPYLLPQRTLTVDGRASGWAKLRSVMQHPIFEAQVSIDSTIFNGAYFGTVNASVGIDRDQKKVLIDGDVIRYNRQAAVVHGYADTKPNGHFQIDVVPDSLPLNFIEHWTHNFLQDIDGLVSGTVSIRGEGRKTYVITRAKPHHVGLTVPWTGGRYFVNDSIFMDSTSITFPHLQMTDKEGNPILFNGRITHNEYFQDFHLDLHATLPNTSSSGTIALDLPPSNTSMFYGKVYATGSVDITGPDDDIVLSATAAATGKSTFKLCLDGARSAGDNSFITFIHPRPQVKLTDDTIRFIPRHKVKNRLVGGSNRFRLGMTVDVDPQTLFQLVLNERTGDVIEARGDASIKLTMDDASDALTLVGTYTIEKGKMGFTIGNLIRRDFTIDPGSQIIWNGNAEKPVLDVTARYQVTASLKDLFGSETQNIISGRTSVPVNTLIHVKGTLDDPIIQFAIELPKSEENIENQVKAVINTDEMMMRQVVYLLVFGKFFTPEYMKTTTANNTALNDTYALLSSTITGQINNWLGKLTNVFTLGFNVRQEGTEQSAAREYEAVFQLQPIDRLIINGNFGYRYNDVSNRPFFGDLDIECLLTPNGKYRLKGYTHTVDKYSLKQASTIQGIGFLFRHDFNWVNPEKRKQKKDNKTHKNK